MPSEEEAFSGGVAGHRWSSFSKGKTVQWLQTGEGGKGSAKTCRLRQGKTSLRSTPERDMTVKFIRKGKHKKMTFSYPWIDRRKKKASWLPANRSSRANAEKKGKKLSRERRRITWPWGDAFKSQPGRRLIG